MKLYISALFLPIYFILSSFFSHAQKDYNKYELGETYFRTLCSSCHSPDQEIYGPMLGSISKKKESWLISFIQNSPDVIKSGDPYAKELFEKFNQQIMPAFKELTPTDIKSILYYLEYQSINPNNYLNDLHISNSNNSNVIQGKQEFSEHCATCHFIHKESTFAPALGSVTKRHPREWLISFIQNSQKKIKEGDPYAQHLFNQFDKHVMTSMDFLSPNEINSILDYIEFSSTQDVAYKGKINKDENKKQAVIQIEKITSRYSVISFIHFALLIPIFFSMLLLLALLQSFYNKNNYKQY